MLCEKCKMREANVQLTEMSNGTVKTHHYCMKCAGMMDLANSSLFEDFPLAKMLAGLLSMQESSGEDKNEYMDIECPTCHTRYADVAENSRFGCPDCYEVFDVLINDTIKQLQGSDRHTGEGIAVKEELSDEVKTDIEKDIAPDDEDVEKTARLRELRHLLKVALADEEYEEAAGYRDQIRALEAKDA